MAKKLLTDSEISAIFDRFQEAEPSPRTELEYVNNYTLLVAVVLSAQATDKGVNKATKALFERVHTPQQMLALGIEGLEKYIKSIGLYHSKARNVIGLSQMLIDSHGGEVPRDFDSLIKLPGVGRKTANVILNCAFGESTMAVDTHVQRVSNRIGIVDTKTVEQTEARLVERIPAAYMQHAHHWLILHGRYICKARKPMCDACMIRDICVYISG